MTTLQAVEARSRAAACDRTARLKGLVRAMRAGSALVSPSRESVLRLARLADVASMLGAGNAPAAARLLNALGPCPRAWND